MQIRILCFLALLSLVSVSPASVVFRPGEKVKYLAPGEEEVNGTAQQLYQIGQAAERAGNLKRAIGAYNKLSRKYPRDTNAAPALYREAQLREQRRDYVKAATAYRTLVERYPSNPHFEEAIEAQFRIGQVYLGAKNVKILGVTLRNSEDRAVEIFAGVVRSAPFGRYTARAQFNIGLARQRQGNTESAVEAYQSVIDKYPNEPVAAEAQYQLGYLWYAAARQGTKDEAAVANAKTGFQDFLYRYPRSEKAPQARANLVRMEQKATNDSLRVAQFYDKQKQYRAAVIYYSEVIRDLPGSVASNQAKRRIDQIRSKVGDSVMQPTLAMAARKKNVAIGPSSSGAGRPTLRGGDSEVAPLPPPEQDSALPPPASLARPATTAPEPPPDSAFEPAADVSPTPGSAPSP